MLRPISWVGLGLLLAACGSGPPAVRPAPAPPPDPEVELGAALDAFDARVASRARALNLAYWDALRGGPGERLLALELEVRRLFADPALAGRLAAALEDGRVRSPRLRRRLAVALGELREHQAPWPSIEALARRTAQAEVRLQGLRFELEGEPVSENELYAVLQEDRDELRRRAAWQGLRARGRALAGELRALAHLRNELARAAGFGDYRRMRLALGEFPGEVLEPLLAELERRTTAAWAEEHAAMRAELAQRHGLPPERLRPWHLEDPFFARAPRAGRPGAEPWFARRDPRALAAATLQGLGAPAEPGLDGGDLEERPGKRFGALCLDVDRAGDVRLLASVRPGRVWTAALLHELGHALYRRRIDPGLPWGLRVPAHPALSEALAVLLARRVNDPGWLRRVAGVSGPELARLDGELRRRARREALTALRFGLLVVAFEAELYRDPDQDLDARWRELRARFLLEDAPEARDAPDWAAVTHLLTAPVSYQDYLLAELLASQLEAWLRRDPACGVEDWSGRPACLELIAARLLAPGASQPWVALLASATGRGPSLEDLAVELGLR